MDLEAIVARQPEMVLVDELAHTNAPGSTNPKRWQDVQTLLELGIDVITTVNIQHLESLNDVIFKITGIRQKETIPDTVVRSADQIELIDMSPDALRRRMSHGNIYAADKIDAALANYFREGNLGALRELALLWVADRVEDELQDYLQENGLSSVNWETRERVLVAMTGAKGGDAIIRRAARMASRLHADLLGVHVTSADGLTRTTESDLDSQKKLLLELGGSYRELVSSEVSDALASFIRSEHITQVVVGSSHKSRWRSLIEGSIVAPLLRKSSISRRSRFQYTFGRNVELAPASQPQTDRSRSSSAAIRCAVRRYCTHTVYALFRSRTKPP